MLSRLFSKSRPLFRAVTRNHFSNDAREKSKTVLKRDQIKEEEQFREMIFDLSNKLRNTKESRIDKLSRMKPIPSGPEPLISLQNNFLYGFEEEDFEGFNPIFKQSFSLENATEGQILKFKKEMARRKFQKEENDTGSPGVRVAMISENILHIIRHFGRNRKDTKCFK